MSKRFLSILGTCTVLALVAPVWAQDHGKPAEKPATAKPADAKPAEKKADEPKAGAKTETKPEAKADKKTDEKGGAAAGGMDMNAMMELMKPGPNHKMLGEMVGDWTYTAKMWEDPAGKPNETTGTAKYTSLLDGRFVQGEHAGKMQMPGPDGKMMDFDFRGIGITGYDSIKKKFVNTWIDNMGTGIMMAEGTYDAATKTFTYNAECEMMPGTKTKVKEVIKCIDKDNHVFEWYDNMGSADLVKKMEITYTRKKGA